LNLRPVRDVVQDVVFNQGLDNGLFRIGFPGGDDGNGIFSIKPAEFLALYVINSKDAPVGFMGMFFFLDGSNDLQGLIIRQVGNMLVWHAGNLYKFSKKNCCRGADNTRRQAIMPV